MSLITLNDAWENYGLVTAHILYGMPDHPSILQEFLWQTYDLAPEFPEVRRFLDFWKYELAVAPIRSVTVAHKKLVCAGQFMPVETSLTLQ